MSTFSVQTESLRTLARDLFDVQNTLQGLGSTVEGYLGVVGSTRVGDSLTGFAGNWSQGIDMVLKLADGLQQVVAGAASTYEESESSIATAASGS